MTKSWITGTLRGWSVRVTALAAGAVLTVTFVSTAAAEDVPTFLARTTLSGYVDAYYAYNFNTPATPCAVVGDVATFNCLHLFDVQKNSFRLSAADLVLEKKSVLDSRGGFRIDVNYGPAAALMAGSGGKSPSQNVQQAYVSYLTPLPRNGRLQFDFGKFLTPAGAEHVDPTNNWNYSRSLLFALAIPHDHVGLRVIYSPDEKVVVTGFLVNGWNDLAQTNTAKRVAVSVSARPIDALILAGTYIGGPETETASDGHGWRDLVDIVVTGRVTSRMSLAFNYDLGNDRSNLQSWQGEAVYLRYQVRDWFAMGLRLEALEDPDGFMTHISQDLQEATVTAEIRHSRGIVMRVEYRIDVTDQPYFLKNVSDTVRTQRILSASWVYHFSLKARAQ